MNHLYRIELRVLFKDVLRGTTKIVGRPTWEHDTESVRVIANGDAEKAISKAKKYVLRGSFNWTDGKGRRMTHVPVRCKLVEVEKICEVQVR